jgi:AcrR family transcriptional regulator
MPKPKDPERDEKRRKQILEGALHCFLSFGFSKTSMEDVAKEAGVSRPLVYLKFGNKDALFAGVSRSRKSCFWSPGTESWAIP